MAMPFGGSTDNLVEGGGYLPSLAGRPLTVLRQPWHRTRLPWRVGGGRSAPARSSPQTSLAEMTTMHDGYGLGLCQPDPPGTVGHGGEHVGYTSLAGCRPEQGVVVVVLSNDMIDTSAVAGPLVDAVSD